MAIDVAGDTLPAMGGTNQLSHVGVGDACLSEDTVLIFLGGQAGEAQRERVDAHLDQCSMCAGLVAAAARDESASSPPASPLSAEAASPFGGAASPHFGGAASPPWPTAFVQGSVLAGRFTIIRFVARGGMGEVYEALDEKIAGRVALKTMLCTLSDSASAIQRLCEEVKLARRIAHRNVCRIHELHEHHDAQSRAPLLFLAMEFVEGKTLKDNVRGNPLPPCEASELGIQLLRGLGAAHDAGVLHLDFKSQNVMLREGRTREAMIMDFSLSRAFETEAHMHASERQLVGTPGYISPEQLECRSTLGPPSDIYSFGVVFYEMLTGRLPFVGQNATAVLLQQLTGRVQRPSHVVPGLTPLFDRFVLKCLQRDPSLRFPDTASALQALEACRLQLQASGGPARRRRAARRLFVASVAALTAGLVAFADARRRADSAREIQSMATELQPQRPEPSSPAAPREPGAEAEAAAKPVLTAPSSSVSEPEVPRPRGSRELVRRDGARAKRVAEPRPSPAPAAAARPAASSAVRPTDATPPEPAAPQKQPFTPANAPARLY